MKIKDFTYKRNNLDKSISPYLQQHANNPVWWQELNSDLLEYAKQKNKPLLLSSGYSTCHWCHVMADGAFSDLQTAKFLNENFICIKIDREMQPDIDSWMMSYLQKEIGQGGWPLNVFTNFELKPFYALMYAPAEDGVYGKPSLLTVIKHINNLYINNSAEFKDWTGTKANSQSISAPNYSDDKERVMIMTRYFDMQNGGLDGYQKFPPHNTLQFLLTINHGLEKVDDFVRFTLATMHNSGLHDPLQGGFYRYCVDKDWKIPHFEKMLYDQAMMLINYSLATKKFDADGYKDAVNGIIKCLDETFEINGLYASAHDADTNHQEGLTYLWTKQELENLLSNDELQLFLSVYHLEEFENKYHLIRKGFAEIKDIEHKLLEIRKKREQAFRDEKIITSWNALTAIGFIFAHRYCGVNSLNKAKLVFDKTIELHKLDSGEISHSSFNGVLQQESFLEDLSSLLLLGTYLYEHRLTTTEVLSDLHKQLRKFKIEGVWYESYKGILGKVKADTHDHPYPSSVSMAEAAEARYKLLINESPSKLHFQSPLSYDYYNLAVKWSRGEFPVIKSPNEISYQYLPPGVIQSKGDKLTICMNNSCFEVRMEELVETMKNLTK